MGRATVRSNASILAKSLSARRAQFSACEHETRRATPGARRLDYGDRQTPGRRLNRPNDVIVKPDGSIYFTDAWSSPFVPEQWHLPFSAPAFIVSRSWHHHARL
jgi:sugar lactone lactonase YvrE